MTTLKPSNHTRHSSCRVPLSSSSKHSGISRPTVAQRRHSPLNTSNLVVLFFNVSYMKVKRKEKGTWKCRRTMTEGAVSLGGVVRDKNKDKEVVGAG